MPQPDCSPSAERNKQPLLEVLRSVLPARGEALEIASGTGQHVAWFAQHLPQWNWQPTDLHRGALYNIEAYTDQAELTNVYAPRQLNVMDTHWLPEGETVDLVLCINMLHIAPWDACAALMQGSARHLAPQGKLVTYGPYFEDGVPPADSNLAPPTLVPYAALSGSLDFANKSGALGKVGLGFGNSYGQCVSNTDVGTVAANKQAPILKPVCGPLNLDCAALDGPAAGHANAQLANQFPLLGLMPCACAAATSKLGVQKIADTLKTARECGATLAEAGKVLGDAAQGTYALGG